MKYNLNLQKVKFDLAEKHLDKDTALSLWSSPSLLAHFKKQDGKPLFVLHDGPPYANGELHLGHFTNKALKDTLLKYKRLNGFYAPFYNGFDCHGLPVELAVEKKVGRQVQKESKKTFLEACYDYSKEQVQGQTSQLKEFGVFADFNESYHTTDHDKERKEMEAVLNLLNKGFLFQKFRPVHWCKDCQSSLAEAELEYKTKQSDSLTVEFKLDERTSLLVWTTTPYTLPANQAVAYNARYEYARYYDEGKNKYYVSLKTEDTPDGWVFVDNFKLDSKEVVSPYHKDKVPLLAADFVENSGTGLVHVAPSFGLDDFHVGEKYGLSTLSYVNEYGKYHNEQFPELLDLNLKDAGKVVLDKLFSDDLVFEHKMFEHEYPHCWRHKTPLFSKASKEWFVDLSELKDKAEKALDDVQFYPENGKNRLKAMLKTRSSWCVSRSKSWGVPLPFDDTEESKKLYTQWLEVVGKKGLSALYEDNDFKPQTLDVWFDSGMTHTTVVKQLFNQTHSDLYLEGSDQHRGWFQSSLLTSMALNDDKPYCQVFTHGFVVDGKGVKFSKSSGNFVPMKDLFKQYSPDVYRVWALDQDYHKDLTFSASTMNTALEKYKKFRNTFRFMLQNLSDYEPNALDLNKMDLLDMYVVDETNELKKEVLSLADKYHFNEVLNKLYVFCDNFSSVYLDSQKDRLYCLAKDDERRKTTQDVLYYVQHHLMLLLSPLLPYSAEEYYSKSGLYSKESVLLEDFSPLFEVSFDKEAFQTLLDLRLTLNKMFEERRATKELSKNNEMTVYMVRKLNDKEESSMRLMLGNPYFEYGATTLMMEKHNYPVCDRCRNTFPLLTEHNLCHTCYNVEKDFL